MRDLEGRGTVVMIGGDLMARARVEEAAQAAGLRLVRLALEDLDALERPPQADVVVLDLDDGGRDLIDRWAALAGEGAPPTIGYFSHVDVALGEHAAARGIEALPRGRFWRTLGETLARS
ncbi:MAG: hypothetical protein ACRDKF_14730 [Actinomycetota bacterium]